MRELVGDDGRRIADLMVGRLTLKLLSWHSSVLDRDDHRTQFALGPIGRRVSRSSRPRRCLARGGVLLRVVLAAELRRLGLTFVPGFLQDRGDLGVGDEALPTLRIPVEEHPDPVVLIGIAKDVRTLGPVLLSLLSALGREDIQEAVEILDLSSLPGSSLSFSCPRRRRSTPMVRRVYVQTPARHRALLVRVAFRGGACRPAVRAWLADSGSPRSPRGRRRTSICGRR